MHFSKRYYSLDQYCKFEKNCKSLMFKYMRKSIVLLISFTVFLHGSPAAVARVVFAETLYTTNVVFIIRHTFTQG